jgi:hypothetical protein
MHVSLMLEIAKRRWTAEEVRALPDDPRHRCQKDAGYNGGPT